MLKLITDLNEIERLSEEYEYENVEFRTRLKGYDIDLDEFDNIVNSMNEQVSAQIDCTKCANCCKNKIIVLDDEDIESIAKGLSLSFREVKTKYIRENEESKESEINSQPCPFLKGNLCSIYEYRPKVCKSYPHLHKEGIMFKLWNIIENTSVCPIVFNVYEQMKMRFY